MQAITPPSLNEAKATVKALTQLLNSRGWAIVNEIMRKEVVDAAMAIANDPRMTLDEINFRRGSIWAAHQLLNLPDSLLARANSDLALAAPTVAPPLKPPAMAGVE